MELRHLRYFVAVAEELNFTRAASRLRVAQPALSSQIKDLEEELKVELFERGRTGVQLTRSGKAFYTRARGILAEAADAANEARSVAGTLTGTLVIGFLSGLHLNYLAPVVTAFKKAQPQVTLDFFHGVNAQQLKALREGRLDVGFIMLPAQLEGYSQEVVWRVPFKVVLPKKHPLAGQRSFELGDLRNEDFVFCTRESRPQFYDEFFRQCVNAGFRPRVVQEVGGYPTNMLGLISVGSGVGVLPHFRGVERLQGIVWRDLIKPKMWNDYALVWRRTATSRVVEKFVSTAREIFPTPKEDDWAEP